MAYSQETVLITGSRGFTAAYLREALLLAGYTVWGTTNDTSLHDWEVYADLTNQASLHKVIAQICPDYVIHLAGISNVVHENTNALYQINLQGTLNLLDAIQKESIPVKKIILASSAYVYGDANDALITEDTLPKPVSHYAMSKLGMEYMALGLYKNLPIVIARPFNYTGVGQQKYVLIPKIIYHFLKKSSTIHLGNMHVYREFNDVRMVAQVYCGLLTHAEPHTIVNICTGRNHCLQEILDLCTLISDHHLEVIIDPAFVRKNEVPVLSGDPTKLLSILPFLPFYAVEDTLRWMFEKLSLQLDNKILATL